MSSLFWQDDYESAASDDRCAPRSRLVIPAKLRRTGTRGQQTLVLDLSLAGYSALASTRLTNGTRCWITLPGLQPRDGEVVWWQAGLVGCAFANLLTMAEYGELIGRFGGQIDIPPAP